MSCLSWKRQSYDFFFPEKRIDISVFVLGVLLLVSEMGHQQIVVLYLCVNTVIQKWNGLESLAIGFCFWKSSGWFWWVISILWRKLYFPEKSRGEKKVISSFAYPSFPFSNRKPAKWFSECLVTSGWMDECISLRNNIACKLTSRSSLFFGFFFFFPFNYFYGCLFRVWEGEDFWFSKLFCRTRPSCPLLQLPCVTWDPRWSNRTSWHLGPPDGWRSSELQVLVALVLPRPCCTCGWVAGLYRQLEVVGQLERTQSDAHHLGGASVAQLSASDSFG